MLRAAVIAVLMCATVPAMAGPADDALANCLIAKTTIALALESQPLEVAYPAAWEACDAEAESIPNTLQDGADNLPLDEIDEHAYHTVQAIADTIHPGYTIDGELGAEY